MLTPIWRSNKCIRSVSYTHLDVYKRQVVIEPGARSIQTYKNVKRLAAELGVRQVRVVANKVRNEDDEAFIRSKIPQEDLLGFIHYNSEIIDADRQGRSPFDVSPVSYTHLLMLRDPKTESDAGAWK